MDNVTFNENELKFPTRKIRFKHQIRNVEMINNLIIVLLEIPYEDKETINNLYAFNILGEQVWKVQPLPEKFPNFDSYLPYENLLYTNGQLKVSDFMGRTFTVDIKTGKLLDMEVFR